MNLILGLVLSVAPGAPPCDWEPRPFTARYEVYEDGQVRGEAVAVLGRAGADWRYRLNTEVRRGLLTGKATQESLFGYDDGVHVREFSIDYSAGPFGRRSEGRVVDGRASGAHRGDAWNIDNAAQAVDRLSLHIAVGRLLACQGDPGTRVSLKILDRGRLRDFELLVGNSARWEGPTGAVATIPVERSSGEKTSTTWYAPALNFLPVRMRDVEPDHSRDLRLIAVDWGDGG